MNCCVCGRRLRGSAWVCMPCERRYGLPKNFADWPEWAKALKCSEQQERRYQQAEAEQRSVPPDALDEGVLQASHLPLVTRTDCVDGLPLSPYSTEAENVAYRQAHGLAEPQPHDPPSPRERHGILGREQA